MSQMSPRQTLNEIFHQALSLQNEKKIDDALVAYQKILDQGLSEASDLTREQASVVSQNMSLLYLQKKDPGLAFVYNQKALFLNARNSQAVDFQKQNKNLLQTTSIPREISFFENINSMGLKYLSIEILCVMTGLLLILVFKNIYQFLIDRKKSDLMNSEIVKFKIVNYISIFLLAIFLILLALKMSDDSELKAILKTAAATVQTAPGENQATVTQAEMGTVFKVLKISNDADLTYVQIKYPGAYSGWVKRADLELLNSTKWPVFIDRK